MAQLEDKFWHVKDSARKVADAVILENPQLNVFKNQILRYISNLDTLSPTCITKKMKQVLKLVNRIRPEEQHAFWEREIAGITSKKKDHPVFGKMGIRKTAVNVYAEAYKKFAMKYISEKFKKGEVIAEIEDQDPEKNSFRPVQPNGFLKKLTEEFRRAHPVEVELLSQYVRRPERPVRRLTLGNLMKMFCIERDILRQVDCLQLLSDAANSILENSADLSGPSAAPRSRGSDAESEDASSGGGGGPTAEEVDAAWTTTQTEQYSSPRSPADRWGTAATGGGGPCADNGGTDAAGGAGGSAACAGGGVGGGRPDAGGDQSFAASSSGMTMTPLLRISRCRAESCSQGGAHLPAPPRPPRRSRPCPPTGGGRRRRAAAVSAETRGGGACPRAGGRRRMGGPVPAQTTAGPTPLVAQAAAPPARAAA